MNLTAMSATIGCVLLLVLAGCDDPIRSGVTAYEPERNFNNQLTKIYVPPAYF